MKDSTNFLGGGQAVDADVNHHGARLDEFACHKGRLPHGGHQDIALASHRRQVARPRMANGQRSMLMK